jgi:hypothetical protein
MEYVVGPILALLVGMKFSIYKDKPLEDRIKGMEEKIELIESRATAVETEMPKKILATISPVARAVRKLNEQVGIQ